MVNNPRAICCSAPCFPTLLLCQAVLVAGIVILLHSLQN